MSGVFGAGYAAGLLESVSEVINVGVFVFLTSGSRGFVGFLTVGPSDD